MVADTSLRLSRNPEAANRALVSCARRSLFDVNFAGASDSRASLQRAYAACVAGLQTFGDPAVAANPTRVFEGEAPETPPPAKKGRAVPVSVLFGFLGLFLILGFLLLGKSLEARAKETLKTALDAAFGE